MPYEAAILKEIINAAANGRIEDLEWFDEFGDLLRSNIMNVHAYRKGCLFGFTEISFDKYEWLIRPDFLEKENLIFGNPDRPGEQSILL